MNKQVTRQGSKRGQSSKQDQSPNKQITRQAQKQERRREEQRHREEEKRRALLRRRILIGGLIALVILAIGITAFVVVNAKGSTSNANQGQTVFNPAYQPVDNIYCDQLEHSEVHYHQH